MTREEIKALRMKMQMTQVEFAKAVGVCRTVIQMWESGRSSPSHLAEYRLKKLAEE
jgi:hypothetical protein